MDIRLISCHGRSWTKSWLPAVAGSLLACSLLPAAQAAMTENLVTSPVAMSLGNAVTADPPGIDSIHFNPAGLARLSGKQESHSFFGASIRTTASFHSRDGFNIGGWTQDPLDGTQTGPVRQTLYIPVYGLPNWRLPAAGGAGLGLSFNNEGSPFTFATASYITQAMSVDRTKDPNDPGRFDGRLVQLQRLVYLSPSVGYKFSETLRVGAAVPIAYSAFALNTDMRMPNTLLGIIGKIQQGWCPPGGGNLFDTLTIGLCGGGDEGRLNPFKKAANMNLDLTAPIDPTVNLGVLWEPADWFGFGVVYQSGSKTKYTGRYTITTEPMLRSFVQGMYSSLFGPIVGATLGMPSSIPQVQSGTVTATIPFPTHWQFGIKLKPVDMFQFNFDANYTKWGDWNAMTFQFDQSIKLLEMARLFGTGDSTKLTIPRGYKSVWHFGYGLQVNATNKLTLRFGYEPRKSSIPKDKIDLVAPLPDTKLYSVGLGYKLDDKSEINIGASYMKGSFNAPANSSCNMNCDNFLNVIYNPYAGMDVSGDIRVRYFGITYNKRF
ncbi:OmpP1/FadL family transporter [Noviherbaspirillum massiliense]|uniref:OmpP1/FadL family transporter n=1 Tax=Noviherbaspirillum massiliense TaxID=1465823 RepID=UPI0006888A75|nr:outer membrane protein transport protein [Noviherbaspirillum massiliense]